MICEDLQCSERNGENAVAPLVAARSGGHDTLKGRGRRPRPGNNESLITSSCRQVWFEISSAILETSVK